MRSCCVSIWDAGQMIRILLKHQGTSFNKRFGSLDIFYSLRRHAPQKKVSDGYHFSLRGFECSRALGENWIWRTHMVNMSPGLENLAVNDVLSFGSERATAPRCRVSPGAVLTESSFSFLSHGQFPLAFSSSAILAHRPLWLFILFLVYIYL